MMKCTVYEEIELSINELFDENVMEKCKKKCAFEKTDDDTFEIR